MHADQTNYDKDINKISLFILENCLLVNKVAKTNWQNVFSKSFRVAEVYVFPCFLVRSC